MTFQSTQVITQYAESVLEQIGIFENHYFEQLQNGAMSFEQFRQTQEQFYFAVAFFARPMAVLVSRIPNAKDRLDILHNVWEEHGENNEEAFHATTFKKFLASLHSAAQLDDMTPCPQVQVFNSAIMASCMLDELEVGICCMGIIEMAFADISVIIGQAVIARGWLSAENLAHYNLHAKIDHRHADEFFRVVAKYWGRPEKQCLIKQGLWLGAHLFNMLYRDLLDHKLTQNAYR